MSSLEKYVEKVKKETEGFSSIEKLRYIYWDLGSKFAFDLDFSPGNFLTRKQNNWALVLANVICFIASSYNEWYGY